MTEEELQRSIIQLARVLRWRVYHTFNSRHSEPGFPDLTMVRQSRLIFAELKSLRGAVTAEQQAWLTDLEDVGLRAGDDIVTLRPRVEVHVWRPADWASGTIEKILR